MIDRYYQHDAREAVTWSWEGYKSNVLRLATGSGKTHIAARIIGDLDTRCLFLADQNELCTQPLRAIRRATGIVAAVEKGRERASLQARVVVGSAQTLQRPARRERYPPDHFTHIIIDEAHRGADRDAEICAHFATAQTCGMTATPFRSGLRDLSKWYETVAYSKPMLDLIAEGFAPPMEVLTLPVEIDLAAVRTAMTPEGRDYKAEDIETTILPYYEAVADLIVEHAKGRFGIAYLPLIRSSQAFAAVLRHKGLTARHVDGGSADREEILEGFARGHFNWLCNAGVVSIGVDLPRADCFLNLAPMRSPALYQQRMGRIMRPWPGCIDDLPELGQATERKAHIATSPKPNALLFDLLWQNDELGVMRPGALVCETEEDARLVFERTKREMSPQDLIELHRRVLEEKELQLVQQLEAAAYRADSRRGVTFEQAAALFGSKKLLRYEPVARWEMDPPTEPQLALLVKRGIARDAVATKGHAKALLDVIFWRMGQNLATVKQVRYLKRNGCALAHKMTFVEANTAVADVIEQSRAEALARAV